MKFFVLLSIACYTITGQMVFPQDHADSLLLQWDSQPDKKYENRKQSLEQIILTLQKKKDLVGQANAFRRLGLLELDKGNIPQALDAYIKSLELLDGLENSFESRASGYNSLAEIYYFLGNEEETERNFLLALENYKKAGSDRGMKAVMQNLSSFYYENEQYGEAKKYLEEYQNRYSGDSLELPYQWNLLGLMEYDEGKYRQALYWFGKAVTQLPETEKKALLPVPCQNQGNCFNELGLYDSAELLYRKAMDLSLEGQDPARISDMAAVLSRFFESRGDTLQAFTYLKTFHVFSDSMLTRENIKGMIDAEQKYQNKAKTEEIGIQKKLLRSRQYLNWILIVLLVLGSGFTFLSFRFMSQKQRLAKAEIEKRDFEINELLQKQEIKSLSAQMLGQNEERQRIARDLHDRLGSLLSTIKINFNQVETELRDIRQKHDDTYNKLLGLVDEAYDEVRKISHDLSSGVLEKFGFKTAVRELISAIESANKLRIHFIDNQTDAEIYTTIEEPLYRISQELLSNTLKYAKASEVNIQVHFHEGVVYYTYEDDGEGFDKAILEKQKGIGYNNINSRVQMMNGKWSLDTSPGHGMTLMIEIPL